MLSASARPHDGREGDTHETAGDGTPPAMSLGGWTPSVCAMGVRGHAFLEKRGFAMPKTSTLHDAFVDELRDLYNAEKQITRALPKMVKAAGTEPLQEAFQAHLEETMQQIDRLEQVFQSIGETPRSKPCHGMTGILEEGKEIMGDTFDESTMDACLIAAAQRVEHYEIAGYGTVAAWAKAMGHNTALKLLLQTLEEEKATDKKLTALAEGALNEQAASGAHGENEEEQEQGSSRGGRMSGNGRARSSRGRKTTLKTAGRRRTASRR
jgi:ferritin-like metal-binding protein YciE